MMAEGSGRPIPVALRYRGTWVDREALRRLVRRCLDSQDAPEGGGLGIVLAGGRFVRRLNREWRGLDRTTDVLSFPYGMEPPVPGEAPECFLLGEIVISVPRCFEQAAGRGADPGEELVRLLIHGALHVLGYDHETAGDRARMVPLERRLRAWARRHEIGPGLVRTGASP